MGNITETDHFEKLAEIEELSNRLEEIDTDIDIQWALRCIEDDHLEGWDGTEEEKLKSARKLIEEKKTMKSDKFQKGMQDIQDKIAKKGIVNIDHDDLRDILDITVTCLEEERLESSKKLIEERELMKLEEELDQEALEWERKDSEAG